MKKFLNAVLAVSAIAIIFSVFSVTSNRAGRFQFNPNSLVVTRSVYEGNAATVVVGEVIPPGCPGGAGGDVNLNVPTTNPAVPPGVSYTCGVASDDGEFPFLNAGDNVWNNNGNPNNDFGISSPIFLDNLTTEGKWLGTLPIPSDLIVTSFSSKSELALNRSVDGKSLTFIGYQGGPGCGPNPALESLTGPNLIDVSASNTPGVCDPTNPVVSTFQSNPVVGTAYYRAVAEVDDQGNISVTDGNAYSGDNGRAAIKGGNGMYYMVGNDNSGNLSKKQLPVTMPGTELINATGVELLVPGAVPPVPPNIGMIGRLQFGSDKPGKDTNFRGITIFDNTVYVSKGSGGNGINTVYQVGSAGTLPTGSAADLAKVKINILTGFPNTAASTSTNFPFGLYFANANTLYVCDEGDGTFVPPAVPGANVADAQSLATAGLQKWVLEDGTWTMVYVLQDGLDIGVQYSVPNYPSSLDPATGGCRNIAGQNNGDGSVTIYAITSTISNNGDNGADPNKLVKITDELNATTLPSAGRNTNGSHEHFVTIRAAAAGEVLRGVAFAPEP